jgi:hypothetical protein
VLGSSKEVWEALGLMPRKVRGPNDFLENHLWSFKKRGGVTPLGGPKKMVKMKKGEELMRKIDWDHSRN